MVEAQENLLRFKSSFYKSSEWTHLNNAGLAPISLPALESIKYWSERLAHEGSHCTGDYLDAVAKAREHLAHFCGSLPEQIAFFQGTAAAVSQVAFGLELKEGDEVLTWDQEYPSLRNPFEERCRRSNAHLVVAKSESDYSTPLESLLKLVSPRTRVIAISWVQYQTGAITDLAQLGEFARSRGILTVVDIIQGLGCQNFNFSSLNIDFACGGSFKWMVSPAGTGFLVGKSDLIKSLPPLAVGAMTYHTGNDPTQLNTDKRTDASRFEPGSKQILEIIALGASAQLIASVGTSVIAEEIRRLGHELSTKLEEIGFRVHPTRNKAKHFVNFSGPNKSTTDKAVQILKQNKVSFALRGPGIRISPHAFNSDEDLDKVIHALTKSSLMA